MSVYQVCAWQPGFGTIPSSQPQKLSVGNQSVPAAKTDNSLHTVTTGGFRLIGDTQGSLLSGRSVPKAAAEISPNRPFNLAGLRRKLQRGALPDARFGYARANVKCPTNRPRGFISKALSP